MPTHFPEEEFAAVEAAAQAEEKRSAAKLPRDPGQIAMMAQVVGWVWIVAAVLTAFLFIGPEQMSYLPTPYWLLIGAGVLLPALMVWFAGAAAREGARARLEAKRLADAAERLLAPAPEAESSARKLAASVRVEISTLDRALEQTLAKLNEIQAVVKQQEGAVDKISAQAQTSGGRLVSGLERERAELSQIAQDLSAHAERISGAITKHTQGVADASKVADAQIKAADAALDQKIASFSAAAALIGDRTKALDAAAQASADSSLRLEQALTNAMEILSKANSLTDAARHSADAAVNAAHAAAGALQDSTARAIEEARQAADIIRGEAANVNREASFALERVRHAARDMPFAQPAARAPAPPQAPPQPEPRDLRPADDAAPSFSWSPAAPRPGRGRPSQHDREAPPRSPEHAPQDGDWSWRELLSNMDDEAPAPQPQRGRGPFRRSAPPQRAADPVAKLAQSVVEPRAHAPAPTMALFDAADIKLSEVFSSAALDRIAQRARNGTQSRRKAVKDAAPEAVRRMAEILRANRDARTEVASFLRQDGARIAEQLGRGRGAMGADITRAFLLLDAADG